MTRGDIFLPQERARCRAKIAADLEQTSGPVFRRIQQGHHERTASSPWKYSECEVKCSPCLWAISSPSLPLLSLYRMDASSSLSSYRPCLWPLGGLWMRSWDVRRCTLLFPYFLTFKWLPFIAYESGTAGSWSAANRRLLARYSRLLQPGGHDPICWRLFLKIQHPCKTCSVSSNHTFLICVNQYLYPGLLLWKQSWKASACQCSVLYSHKNN